MNPLQLGELLLFLGQEIREKAAVAGVSRFLTDKEHLYTLKSLSQDQS